MFKVFTSENISQQILNALIFRSHQDTNQLQLVRNDMLLNERYSDLSKGKT